MIRRLICLPILIVSAWCFAACASQVASPGAVEALPEAITVPYRISSEGRFIIDISVNGQTAQPFAIDTGATVSVLYENHARSLGFSAAGQSIVVRGLVAIQTRPIVEDVAFQIGSNTFNLDRVALLATPETADEATGLLGIDVLSEYTVVFNRDAMTATLVPSRYVSSRAFKGWRRIPLRKRVGLYPDHGLHFAQTTVQGRKVPVLIDTGSSLNIVNWPLAMLDDHMRRYQRSLRDEVKLQGANEISRLRVRTLLNELILGGHYWSQIAVMVIELDTLSTVAPVDEPMMIAGAPMFTPWTIAIDFGGDTLYVRANPDDPAPETFNGRTARSWLTVPRLGDESS